MRNVRTKVIPLRPPQAPANEGLLRCRLIAIDDDGVLRVQTPSGEDLACDWLDRGPFLSAPIHVGDVVLVLVHFGEPRGVVLGRVGSYPGDCEKNLRIDASESVSVRCGESSIDLRADGRLAVRGDDVLIRARGRQRIKGGTVDIN